MVGAGGTERIYHQMNSFPIEIIGYYGMEHSIIDNGVFKIVRSDVIPVDHNFFINTIKELRNQFNLNSFYGEGVEFHASGVVTFPLIGTTAPIEEKIAYDPDRKKRQVFYPAVKKAFSEYNVFIGGSSSFDITQKQYNKFYAIKRYCEENAYTLDDVLYVGDDFEDGGNDSHVRIGKIDYVEITDYKKLGEKLSFLL